MTDIKLTTWDPLEAAYETDKDVLASAKKREIKNILKSYVSNYDPLSELIQNALDATEKRIGIEDNYEPHIQIIVNLQENSFEVIDNGFGFEQAEFRSFLAPSISFKSGGKTRGNKGVGVTYIAYGFNDLTIRTKNIHFTFQGTMRRGREWIEDTSGTISRPVVEVTSTKNERFEDLEQGTSFKIVFSGDHVRPSNLGWYQATTPQQWLYLLLLKTPLGVILLPSLEASSVKFDIHVIDKQGKEASATGLDARYKYPHNEINASQRLSKIKEIQLKAIRAVFEHPESTGIPKSLSF
jgi:hypothetical protein